ncbi:MAG: hypothetical protein ABR577_02325 [Pyrinomonadaceae bacterium]
MKFINEKTAFSDIGGLRALSSIRDDVWHADTEAGAYEWWYFDATSDDGRETLVIIFLAGFMFSPRYNRAVAEHLQGTREPPQAGEFPAVAVSLYRDGHFVWRAINEYEPHELSARTDHPECRIGSNCFGLSKTGEAIYELQLDTPLRGGRRLQASLAWKMIEGNFSSSDETKAVNETTAHVWNLVAPRCRVVGTINISEANGKQSERREWAGTGYHDHNRDTRWMPATICEWQWGRAHFIDSTAIFYRYLEHGQTQPVVRLYTVRDKKLISYEPQFHASRWRRHLFGLRYPRDLRLIAGEGAAQWSLQIEQQTPVDSSFFYLRFTGNAILHSTDGTIQRTPVITEQLMPSALKRRSLWWLTNMRIGRGGRASFLP